MKVELENVKPMDIEKRSFEIITEELGDKKLVPGTEHWVQIIFVVFGIRLIEYTVQNRI